MKKLRYSRRAVRSQEQPAPLETRMLPEIQAQAKQGTITASSGDDAAIMALGAATPVTNTLAGQLADAFGVAAADKKGFINLGKRRCYVVPAAQDMGNVVNALTLLGTFTLDDPSKNTGQMTLADKAADSETADALEALTLPSVEKPSLSPGKSLGDKIEDIVTDPEGPFVAAEKSVVIVVDQVARTTKVYEGDAADLAGANFEGAVAENAGFTQTLTPASGRQYGES